MSYVKPLVLLVLSVGLWRVAAASSDAGTLLVEPGGSFNCVNPPILVPAFYGFPAGSYSPTGLTGGEFVAALQDGPPCRSSSVLQISGFSTNPGQAWLSSVKCGTVTNTGSTATYEYGGGSARWGWSTPFGFGHEVGSNVSCTINHS